MALVIFGGALTIFWLVFLTLFALYLLQVL